VPVDVISGKRALPEGDGFELFVPPGISASPSMKRRRVGLGVIADNLVNISRAMAKQPGP
jgi:hypothetical protein